MVALRARVVPCADTCACGRAHCGPPRLSSLAHARRQPTPFSLPSTTEWRRRLPNNLSYWLGNYVWCTAATAVVMVFLHPRVLIWSLVFAALGYAAGKYEESASAALPVINGFQLRHEHLKAGVIVGGSATMLYLIGHEVLEFVGACATLVMSHAMLRTPVGKDVEEEDEERDFGGAGDADGARPSAPHAGGAFDAHEPPSRADA